MRSPRQAPALNQVAKLTIYVAGCTSGYLPVIEQARVKLLGHHEPADTLIGVARLARPEFLIEVDAIAVKSRIRRLREIGAPAKPQGLVEPRPAANHA